MKDLFSAQAKTYAQFRPNYQQEFIDYIVSFVGNKGMALDVATGNGHVAVKLAPHFKEVYATDISEKQLANAMQADNITYLKSKAEETGFEPQQFDLIVVAQAIHWFDFDTFYKEVYRTLKPDGIFVVTGYGQFSTNAECDRLLVHLHRNILGPYWDPERRYVDENYETIPFPFEEIETKPFTEKLTWDFEHLLGYIHSWSATQHYINQNGHNPVDGIREELKQLWAESDKQVTFPLLLRIGRISDFRG